MKAAKAYLAVLGTTGLLTATVVVLLVVGSGVAAFEGPPDAGGTTSPLERIVVDEDMHWADRAAPGRAADRRRSASGKDGARGLRERLRGGLPLPAPVRDTVGGVVDGATGVVGGPVDGVERGAGPPDTEVVKGWVLRPAGGSGD